MKSGGPPVESVAIGLALLFAAIGDAAAQGDVKAGRETAQKCEVCHGLDGLCPGEGSKRSSEPSLNDRKPYKRE